MSTGYTESFGGPADLEPYFKKPTFVHSNPRSVVMINGSPYLPVRWETTRNGHGATDSATITLSLWNNPDFSIELFKGQIQHNSLGAENLGLSPSTPGAVDETPIYVQIFAGYPKDLTPGSKTTQGMTTRFLGIVDSTTGDPEAGVFTFSCRSLAAPLVDNKLTNVVMGMTSVQFAQSMADALGIRTAITDFASIGKTPITLQEMLGREFIGGAQYNEVIYNQKPWDLLLQCSQFDDADIWVDGDVLNYQITDFIKRNSLPCVFGENMIRPRFSHAISASKQIRVEVRSYQKKTRTSSATRFTTNPAGGVIVQQNLRKVTSSPIFGTNSSYSTGVTPTGSYYTESSSTGGAVSSGVTKEGSESQYQTYKIYRPNLDPKKANDLAKALRRKYSEQEYTISFTLSMTPSVLRNFSITSKMDVAGLPHAEFNQSYYPRRYVETYDPETDWSLDLDCCSLVLANGAV